MRYEEDGFDPTPYDRILGGIHTPAREPEMESVKEEVLKEVGEPEARNFNDKRISQIDDMRMQESIRAEDRYENADLEETPEEYDIREPYQAEEYSTESGAYDFNSEGISQIDDARAREEKNVDNEYETAELTSMPDVIDERKAEAREGYKSVVLPEVKSEYAESTADVHRLSAEDTILKTINFTDVCDENPVRIFVEEDILVPDIKPDLASILSMNGSISCNEREIKTGMNSENSVAVTGDINLKTIYLPEKQGNDPVISIQSRIPFRADWAVEIPAFAKVSVVPQIEKVEYSVINERKFRAKITILLLMRKFIKKNLDIFEGIKGEEVQLLKEKMTLTDVAARKTDTLELSEDLSIKETIPEPAQILRYDIRTVENNKQITAERAVVSGSVYYSILYLAKQEDEEKSTPFMCQGRTDFTQFITLNSSGNHSGSRVSFDDSDLSIKIKTAAGRPAETDDDDDYEKIYGGEELSQESGNPAFVLEGNLSTTVEVYRNLENEIATDVYHNEKELVFESEAFDCGALEGSGVVEMSVREILNIPQEYGDVERVVFISGRLTDVETEAEYGKQVVSGNLEVEVIAASDDEERKPFKISRKIPFRGSMDILSARRGMAAECDAQIRELRCDKINSRQIEVTAGVFTGGTVYSKETQRIIKNPAFLDAEETDVRRPGIVIYVTKEEDSLWSIAKNFRTTTEKISRVNSLEDASAIREGLRLLIIK